MPELPEVETTRRGIEPHVLGQSITDWTVRNPRLRWPVEIPAQLQNQTVTAVQRRGKYILICTAVGTLLVHLGMSGSLRILEQGAQAGKHDHVDINFSNHKLLRLNDPRRFGCVRFQAGSDPNKHTLLKNLGIEPLSNEFHGEHLFAKSRNRKVAVKNFIMNSKVVVGVGNIYAAEALFTAGLRPRIAAGRIPRRAYDRLAQSIVEILQRALRAGGTTLRDFVGPDGNPGYFAQTLNVYGRQGQACRTCSTTLKLQIVGQRSSVYCPKCQTSQGFS